MKIKSKRVQVQTIINCECGEMIHKEFPYEGNDRRVVVCPDCGAKARILVEDEDCIYLEDY